MLQPYLPPVCGLWIEKDAIDLTSVANAPTLPAILYVGYE